MTDIYRPGTRVKSMDDSTYTGVVLGPSGYEGGSKVRFDNGQTYPASQSRLEILQTPAGPVLYDLEISDFDNWQFFQSLKMIRREEVDQIGRYRLDKKWHHRVKGEPYKAK
jgi:hypothetical protein